MLTLLTFICILVIGFMMGTIYRHSTSHTTVFNFDYKKIRLAFWITTAVIVVICDFLCFRTMDVLDNMGEANDKAHIFLDNEMMLVFFMNLGFLMMMVLSNLVSIAARSVRWLLYIVTFIVFGGFAYIDNFMLGNTLFEFKKLNQLWLGEFNLAPLKGYLSLAISFALCVFNAAMTFWSLRKPKVAS